MIASRWRVRSRASRRTVRLLLNGSYRAVGNDPNVFVYRREGGSQAVIIALNMSGETRIVDLGGSKQLRVVMSNIASRASKVVGVCVQLVPFEAVALEASR